MSTTITNTEIATTPLRRLSVKEVGRLFSEDDKITTALHEIELWVYENKDGSYSVGLEEGLTHEHDRWLFTKYRAENNMWVWKKEFLDNPALQNENLLLDEDHIRNDIYFLGSVVRSVKFHIDRLGEEPVSASQIVAAVKLVGTDTNILLDIDYTQSIEDIHNLIHHFDEFSKTDPDYAEALPELVRSMYGLPEYPKASEY